MPAQVVDQDKLWGALRAFLPEHLFESWLKGTNFRQESETRYILEVPNAVYRKRLGEFIPKLTASLGEILGTAVRLDIRVIKSLGEDSGASRESAADEPPATDNLEFSFSGTNLNPKYTFDRFVVGKSNNFAHAAALAVAESPGEIYNPLFLYGGAGLGKTHLMHAIGHFIKRKSPQAVVNYMTSEQFTNEYVASIRTKNTTAFRYKYRNMDILLIDDVHFISGKDAVQEEIFHTFNEIHGARKHVILSSDRPPKDILDIEDRLRSRFEWGLTADIQPPDYETRVAILMDKAQRENLAVRKDVLEFIAENVRTNIRELEGCLTLVGARSKVNKQDVTLEFARELLRDIVVRRRNILTPDGISGCVANYFKVSVEELKSKRRTQNIVYPRMMAMYLIRKFTDYSLQSIGGAFGSRDHTTVIHAIGKIEGEATRNPQTMRTLDNLMKELGVN